MANADSSYTDLAETRQPGLDASYSELLASVKRLGDEFFTLGCEVDAMAKLASFDDASPTHHVGFLLGRFADRLNAQIDALQRLSSGVAP